MKEEDGRACKRRMDARLAEWRKNGPPASKRHWSYWCSKPTDAQLEAARLRYARLKEREPSNLQGTNREEP